MEANIKLNNNEKLLFNELKLFCKEKNIIPRVAGGWVRDKLLGLESSDVDITVDTISGYQFALQFSKATNLSHTSIGRISVNPDKSKHLETATLKIEDMQIDFLQLRSETYSTTRIPTIEIASASVDAHRRDITINSLFYNIMTGEIEDYTNGLEDIKKGIIKTPLDPRVTFLDDPLRILRVIRFAIRFDFKINESIFDALLPFDVKLALVQKVSNERIGIEIKKIIEFKSGYTGMLLLIENNLMEAVFKICRTEEDNYTVASNTYENNYYSTYNDPIKSSDKYSISKKFTDKIRKCKYSIDRSIFNLYTCLLHYRWSKIDDQYINSLIVFKHLAWPRSIIKRIDHIEKLSQKFVNLILNDYEIVYAIRQMKEDWLNIIYLLYSYTDDNKFLSIIDFIYSNKYDNAYLAKPIIKADALKKELNCKNYLIGVYLECSVIYQIIFDLKDPAEILVHVRKQHKL